MKKPALPEWYWHAGMHDSAITDIEIFEFPFDDGKFQKEKRKDDRNMLKLTIDTEASLGDPDVREIHFYNFKILSPYRKLRKGGEFWWLSDTLKGSEDTFLWKSNCRISTNNRRISHSKSNLKDLSLCVHKNKFSEDKQIFAPRLRGVFLFFSKKVVFFVQKDRFGQKKRLQCLFFCDTIILIGRGKLCRFPMFALDFSGGGG